MEKDIPQIKISLKAARVNADFSLRDAAKKLGIAYQTLSRYEANPQKVSQEMAMKMSALYRIDRKYIRGW